MKGDTSLSGVVSENELDSTKLPILALFRSQYDCASRPPTPQPIRCTILSTRLSLFKKSSNASMNSSCVKHGGMLTLITWKPLADSSDSWKKKLSAVVQRSGNIISGSIDV